MEFRVDCKELNDPRTKLSELRSFHERAIRRIDPCYTANLINAGNCYQRQQGRGGAGDKQIKVDSLATSTVGFIGHLNRQLLEMQAKSDSK